MWVALALASVLPFLYTYTLVNRARFAARFALAIIFFRTVPVLFSLTQVADPGGG